jgi:hypothetical protein
VSEVLLPCGTSSCVITAKEKEQEKKEGVVEERKRLAVFSIRKNRGGSIWVRAGSAFINRDGSLNLYLDVLPLDGTLHVREPGEKREQAPAQNTLETQLADTAAVGGH